jgi:phage-related protein
MTVTFTPAIPPGVSSSKKTEYRVKKADFGDGMVQVAKDGVNNVTVTWSLIWPVLSVAQGLALQTFFNARAGYESFFYTVPGDIQRLYRSGETVMAYDQSGVLVSFSVTLTEVH